MSNIDKRALRVLATALDGDDWHAEGNSVYGGRYDVGDNVCYDHIASCESVNGKSPHADFIAAANPATVLALLDELEAKDRKILKLEKLAEAESVGADKAATSGVEWMKRYHAAEKRIAELERKEQHSERQSVIDALAGSGEEWSDIEEYMQKWDAERASAAGKGE